MLSSEQADKILEEHKFGSESNERLRNSIRETLNGFTVKPPAPYSIGPNSKK